MAGIVETLPDNTLFGRCSRMHPSSLQLLLGAQWLSQQQDELQLLAGDIGVHLGTLSCFAVLCCSRGAVLQLQFHCRVLLLLHKPMTQGLGAVVRGWRGCGWVGGGAGHHCWCAQACITLCCF